MSSAIVAKALQEASELRKVRIFRWTNVNTSFAEKVKEDYQILL